MKARKYTKKQMELHNKLRKILADPDKIDITIWMNFCETVGCIGGWTTKIAKLKYNAEELIEESCAKALGFSKKTAEKLFYGYAGAYAEPRSSLNWPKKYTKRLEQGDKSVVLEVFNLAVEGKF